MTNSQRMDRAKALVQRLQAAGQTPDNISEALESRVSPRTIYRWSRGETAPQNLSNVLALERLVTAVGA